MEKLKERLQKLKFRLLLLPADNHSGVPVTVIGFRKGMIYFGALLLVTLVITFFIFRFTPLNALVDVKAELSDADKATINNLNKKVTILATELNRIRRENDRMKFLLTLTDTSEAKKKDSLATQGKKDGKNKKVKK